MSKVKNLTKETFNPDDFTYVDLGLPSRRLWATENAPGYYTYDEAKEVFGHSLPKAAALVELWEECNWTWDDKRKGMTVTGPNGNSIFLPASGYRNYASGGLYNVGGDGNYWSYASNSQASARYLDFNSGGVYPLSTAYRAYGFSVRPCREFV